MTMASAGTVSTNFKHLQDAMRDMTQTSMRLCVPRTSRSLSPHPGDEDARVRRRQAPMARAHSDRNSQCRSPQLIRSNSLSGSRSVLSLLPELSSAQIHVLRKSWRHVNTKGLSSVLGRCFQRLENCYPSVSSGFREEKPESASTVRSVVDHAKFMAALFERIINEGGEDMDIDLKRIGANHAFLNEEFGVGVGEIERLGEIIAEVMLRLDGIRQSKEATKLWRLLIAKVIDHVRDGFETELRFRRRKMSAFQPGADNRRNSMPNSTRKVSVNLDVGQVTRKLSNYR